jgi:hypothetical protein
MSIFGFSITISTFEYSNITLLKLLKIIHQNSNRKNLSIKEKTQAFLTQNRIVKCKVFAVLNSKDIFVTLSLSALILSIVVLPVFAVSYIPGVSKGQYVTYGNFIGIGPGLESFNNTSYVKQEITDVSGTQVTLLTTGQFKDGTPTPGNGTTAVWDIAAGTMNGVPSTEGPIIAANLNQGDPIPPPNTYTVNKTETQIFLGVSRSVNILSSTIITPDYTTALTFIYDRASGMLLEASSTTTQNQPQATPSEYSYSIIDTNIFGTGQVTPTPTIPEYSLVAAVAIIILATLATVILQKNKSTKKTKVA